MNRQFVAVLLGLICIAGASKASAESKTHDGFFLQMAAGLGFYRTAADAGATEVTYSGLTVPISIMLGGTILKHLVIGGGTFVDVAPSPKYKVNGSNLSQTPEFKQFIVGVGGMLDYYVWSDKGLHFPIFVGWGGLETAVEGNAWGSDPTGLVMYFGGGYDFWISDNWSVGALFRLVVAPIKFNEMRYTTIAPVAQATITFN